MIAQLISFSVQHRFFVLLLTCFAIVGGIVALQHTPLDAIPDLSDVQVIVYTEWPERSPTLVEDQVTYPIVTSLLSAPKVKVVRGYSFFGSSFVYVIFQDGTDLYWARSRVLEYMQAVAGRLPTGVAPVLGPDATGVGWGFQYAVVDTSGTHDLAQLRTLNDWYIRYWLQAVPGVAEVARIGGYERQYQVEVNPNTLLAYKLPLSKVIEAIRKGNNDTGGRVVEFSGREYMVRGRGYIQSVQDIEKIGRGGERARHAHPGQRRRPGTSRPRDSPRLCRIEWRGGSGGRHRGDALRRECAGRHRTGEAEDRRDRAQPCRQG